MENMNNNQNFDNTVSGVERVSKKKGKKIALISGIAVVAIAGGGVAAYNLSDYVKNQVNLRVMKPENYYSWVIEENSKEFASKAKDSYSKVYDKATNSYGSSFNLKYNISDDAKDIALTSMIGEDYRNSADDEEKVLIDIFDNLSEIAIGGNISSKTNMLSGNISALLNGESIIDSDIAMDLENFDYFLRVPELNEQWLCLSLGSVIDGTSVNMKQNIYEYLTPEQLEDIIVRYSDIWNESVSDIELEKQETVDICDISVEYTVISAEFDKEKYSELATKFINELKNDDVIKNIVVNQIGEYTEEEYNSSLDDLLKQIEESDTSENDVNFTLNTYVDPNGDIRGVKMIQDTNEISFVTGKDGDNVRAEFSVNEDGENNVSMELYADKDGNKYNGNIDFNFIDYDTPETISVEFKDYEVVNEDNGYVNADVTFIIPDVDPIAIKLSSDGNSQDISYNINIDDTDYGTITLSISEIKDAEVSIPNKDESFVYDFNSDFSIKDYIPQENMQTFIENLLKKIGFGDELSAEGAKEITDDIYYEYEDWDTDYYDTDIDNIDDPLTYYDDNLDSEFDQREVNISGYSDFAVSGEITLSDDTPYSDFAVSTEDAENSSENNNVNVASEENSEES